jgi:class 3 adenylate cyclase
LAVQEIASWLSALELSEYAERFAENGVDIDVLPELTDQDLEKMGVLLGHRRRMLRAIRMLDSAAITPSATAAPAPPQTRAPSQDSAERRQLTVMFCDLVGSTALSERLDPEDLRDLIGAYHKCVAETISRFDGFVAQYLGDGVLAYFGYPQAHEDDPERAVRAGLALINVVGQLHNSAPLQVRIGIGTGLVVVGDLIGSGDCQDLGVVGETPNLAARLQAVARPNTVVIGPTTRRLLAELFEYQDLGPLDVKGFSSRIRAYEVIRPSSVESRFEALRTTATALVGRTEELEILMRRWEQAKQIDGSVVLISGEPGIGKSRITQAVLDRLRNEPHTRLRYFCSPLQKDSELYPIAMQLERAAGFRRDDSAEERLTKLEILFSQAANDLSEAVPLLSDLLSIPSQGRYQPLNFSPQKRKEKTLQAKVTQIRGLAARQPVLMIFEDIQWSDPTSLELLDLLIELVPEIRALIIATFRPEFIPPWIGRPQVTLLSLNRLPPRQRVEMIKQIAGKALPQEIVEQIVERTDGVALFIEELTKAVVESGVLVDAGDHYTMAGSLPALAIPPTLQASLLARLDRLAPVREVAQIAAALGRQFSHELISAVAQLPQQQLDDALIQLVNAELIFRRGVPPDSEYTFKHVLVQDAAYGTMIRSRRQQFHARIATTLERQFPEIVSAQPALLAHHCAEAGLTEKAVGFWLRAGQQANLRCAMKEALAHLSNGIALLGALPEGRVRDEREIDFQLAQAVSLIAMHGYGSESVEVCATRLRELSDGLGEHPTRFAVYRVVWNSCLLRRPVPQSVSLARELMSLAHTANNPSRLAIAHRALGYSLHIAGVQPDADKLLGEGIALADSISDSEFAVFGEHPGMICRGYRGVTRCLIGFLDQGAELAEAAVQHARTRNNPFSLAWALYCAGQVHKWRRDFASAERVALEAISVSGDHGLPQWLAFAKQTLGWAMFNRGDVRAGIEAQQEGMRSLHGTGSVLHSTQFQLHLAESFLNIGELRQASIHLKAGFEHAESHGETYMLPELFRVHIFLLQAEGAPEEKRQEALSRGLSLARSQGAPLLELRLAMAMAKLQIDGGRDARELVDPVYAIFTEGLDTPDLVEARALLGTPNDD